MGHREAIDHHVSHGRHDAQHISQGSYQAIALQFYSMTEKEGEEAARYLLENGSTPFNEVIHYVQSVNDPKIEYVLLNKINLDDNLKNKRQSKSSELTRKDVLKLHHFFGHATSSKLSEKIEAAGRMTDNVKEYLKDIAKCEVCKVEGNRIPRPRYAPMKATNFNHVVVMDLKENRRYPDFPPYIIYIIDAFTKFKAAAFIKNKQASTVIEAILDIWIKVHGCPKYFQSD